MANFDYKCRMIEEELQSFWPGWHVVTRLGGGAYGDVYRIYRDNNMGIRTDSALKVIQVTDNHTNSTAPPESVLTEIRIMELLRGAPNIVTIEDCYYRKDPGGSGLARLFIRMELLQNFEDILRQSEETVRLGWDPQQAFMPVPEVCRLGIDICTALDYCEKYQIIHRDIKPANLFIDKFGNYKVGDFGVSRQVDSLEAAHTMTGIGTISYMAPEIYMRRAYNHTVDIYALGLVLYRLLNYGRSPFVPDYPTALTVADVDSANYQRLNGAKIQKIRHIDKQLNKIILKACAYRPEARYQTAQEFRDALENYLQAGKDYDGVNRRAAAGGDAAAGGRFADGRAAAGGGQDAFYGTGQGTGTAYATGQETGTAYATGQETVTAYARGQEYGTAYVTDGTGYETDRGTVSASRNTLRTDNTSAKSNKTLIIAALIMTLAGVIAAFGFHIAESNTRKASYYSYIRCAENSSDFEIKMDYYKRAIDRQPSKTDAYDSLLTYIEEDQSFDKDENTALEKCLYNHSETSGDSTNIDYFRSKNRSGYDRFEFRLGRDYFSYLKGGKADAHRCFEEVIESSNLSEQDKKIANSLYNLTDYYAKLGQTNQNWAQGSGQYSYADFWDLLQRVTADPNTIDEQTGDVPYSVAMYREVASQIAGNFRQFRNAGVTEQQMRDVMTAADTYLSGLDKSTYSNLYEALIPQTESAIEDARSAIAAAFEGSVTDTGTYEAPSQ